MKLTGADKAVDDLGDMPKQFVALSLAAACVGLCFRSRSPRCSWRRFGGCVWQRALIDRPQRRL